MNWPASPPWLSELQTSFGQLLRTPLERRSGTLRAASEGYPESLLRAARPGREVPGYERLAVYHRQYWFRLFTVLQQAFPLTARLLGYWTFNQYAARFLELTPPRGWDIDAIGEGFAEFVTAAEPTGAVRLENTKRTLAAPALHQAAAIDAAYHRVFRAPAAPIFLPRPDDAERLLSGRLRLSPAAAVLHEDWPLCDLRKQLSDTPGEAAIPLPKQLDAPRSWLLVRKQVSMGLLPLEPREAELLRLLQEHTVPGALAHLEAACSPKERAELPLQAQAWLARSVRMGLWSSLEPA